MNKETTRPRPELVLGIETATAHGGVALVSPAGILGEITLLNPESHAERLLPAAEQLLAILGHGVRDLAAIAVSRGPGSFTGLRIGIAAAKGLAFALEVPLYAIPTLAVLAANAAPREGPVCALLNARRGEVFRAIFRGDETTWEPMVEEEAVPVERLLGELPRGCLVVGEVPALLLAPGLSDRLGIRLAPPHLGYPRAAVVGLRGLERLRAGEAGDPGSMRPRYLRSADAQAPRAQRPGFVDKTPTFTYHPRIAQETPRGRCR